MGKSAMSCFNIITCSRDSAGYDDLELFQSRASSDRRRWSFRKRSAGPDSVVLEPPTVKESQETSHTTFCPPEDGVSLDAVCSKEDDGSCITEERTKTDADVKESAAIVIQAATRRCLARKDMKKLKSIIKLQAAVRGRLVRRQAAGTLRCVHAIIRMQALVRVRFVHQPVENSRSSKESSGTKHRKTYSATEKLLANGFARQLFESTSKTKPIHIYCDPSRSDSAWKWLERWMALASLDIAQQQELSTNHSYQDQSKDIKVSVSGLENDVPIAVGPVSAHSQPAISVLQGDSAQLINDHASDFEFQAPAVMDECFCPPIKTNWGSHQSKSDPQNVAQENHIKDEATKECPNSNSGGMVLKPGYASQSPDAVVDKPEFEKEKSNCADSRVECVESLDSDGKKSVSDMRKACNPAFLAAQSKFKDPCSASSFKSVSTSKKDVSIGSRPENSILDYLTKVDASFTEDSAPHVPGGQAATSECDTELSITSTLDSPERSEAEGGEIVLEIGSFGSRDFDVNGHSDNASKDLNPEAKNLSAPEILQPPKVAMINENATNFIAADNSVQIERQPSLELHLAETLSDIQVQQENVIDQEVCNSSSGGSPRSDTTALDSHKTPSIHVSLHTKTRNNENNMHERKQRSQVAVKRSLSNLDNDSGGRSSTEHSNNGEKRNSFGTPKLDHADQEPRVSSSNSLPNYMQTTESARAKVHASNSPKSSPDVNDHDSSMKKRHSLPLANGKQVSSPRMQQSSSQTQRSPHKSAGKAEKMTKVTLGG